MKFEVEVECTPQEARSFMGLPDLTPLHDAWIEQMKGFTTQGASADEWNKMIANWTKGMPGMSEGLEAWQKLMLTASGMAPKKDEKAKAEK